MAPPEIIPPVFTITPEDHATFEYIKLLPKIVGAIYVGAVLIFGFGIWVANLTFNIATVKADVTSLALEQKVRADKVTELDKTIAIMSERQKGTTAQLEIVNKGINELLKEKRKQP